MHTKMNQRKNTFILSYLLSTSIYWGNYTDFKA